MSKEEENQSVIDELKKEVEALKSSKQEILNEKKEIQKKYRDNDEASQKFYKLQDDFDELSDNYKKLEHTNKVFERDLKTLTETNESLNSTNSKMIIDDGISKELRGLERFKVRDGGLDVAVRTLKEMKPTIVDGVAMFGDKTSKEFIYEWANSDNSKFYLTPKVNSGGGGNGGSSNGNSGDAKYFDKKSTDFSLTKQAEILKNNPAQYAQLSK